MNFCHPSERGLSLPDERPGRHIATGQRCFCFSSSSAKTEDRRATATDTAQSQTGSNNVQARGRSRVQQITTGKGGAGAIAAGDNSVSVGGNVSAGNVSAAQGATVSVGVGGADLATLVDKLSTASSNQISSVVSALAPSGPASPAVAKLETSTSDFGDKKWLWLAGAVAVVLVYRNSKR